MDRFWQFVAGKAGAERREHRGRIKHSAGLGHDNRNNRFAEIGMRHSDHRAFFDADKRIDFSLNLFGSICSSCSAVGSGPRRNIGAFF